VEIVTTTPVIVAALVQVAISVGLYGWGRHVARRQGGGWWRWAASAPLVALVLSLIGVTWGVVGLVRAFGAVSRVDASMKATTLALAISEAMNCSALFVLPSWILYLGAVVIFIIGSLRQPRGADAVPTGGPRGP
jgi:hypothetical protein